MNDSQVPASSVTAAHNQPVAAAPRSRGPSTTQLTVVVAILAVGVVVTALTSDVTKVSEPGVQADTDGSPLLIEKAGDWVGGEKSGLTEQEQALLPKDTAGARRLFKDSQGDELYCSIVLAGRDVTSIHRPELCLPGQGWKIASEHAETLAVPAAPGGHLAVMRMNATREVPMANGQTATLRSVFVYWFVGKNRETPYHWQRIFWTARDRILHNTNHRWAYILIHAQVRSELGGGGTAETEDDAMKVIGSFVRDLYPSLVGKNEKP